MGVVSGSVVVDMRLTMTVGGRVVGSGGGQGSARVGIHRNANDV